MKYSILPVIFGLLFLLVDAQVVTPHGLGSTLDSSLLHPWASLFSSATSSHVSVIYNTADSLTGVQTLLKHNATGVNFAASDAPVDAVTLAIALRAGFGNIVHVPFAVTGAAIVFNVPGLSSLDLTPDVLARILTGSITSWADPALVTLNPSLTSIQQSIVVCVRSDPSGPYLAISQYLTHRSPSFWPAGVNDSTTWPSTFFLAQSDHDLMMNVINNNFSLGFAWYPSAQNHKLPAARLASLSHGFVAPSPASFSAAAEAVTPAGLPAIGADWSNFTLVNAEAAGAYPLAAFEFFITYQDQTYAANDGAGCTINFSITSLSLGLAFLHFALSPAAQNLAPTYFLGQLSRLTLSYSQSAANSMQSMPPYSIYWVPPPLSPPVAPIAAPVVAPVAAPISPAPLSTPVPTASAPVAISAPLSESAMSIMDIVVIVILVVIFIAIFAIDQIKKGCM